MRLYMQKHKSVPIILLSTLYIMWGYSIIFSIVTSTSISTNLVGFIIDLVIVIFFSLTFIFLQPLSFFIQFNLPDLPPLLYYLLYPIILITILFLSLKIRKGIYLLIIFCVLNIRGCAIGLDFFSNNFDFDPEADYENYWDRHSSD